jgi:hypothetical protein
MDGLLCGRAEAAPGNTGSGRGPLDGRESGDGEIAELCDPDQTPGEAGEDGAGVGKEAAVPGEGTVNGAEAPREEEEPGAAEGVVVR